MLFSLDSLVFEIIKQMKAQGTEFFVMACVASILSFSRLIFIGLKARKLALWNVKHVCVQLQ